MNLDEALKIVLRPYITEKTFAMVENEKKIVKVMVHGDSKINQGWAEALVRNVAVCRMIVV